MKPWMIAGVTLSLAAFAAVALLHADSPYPFSGDVDAYRRGAMHFLSDGFYSLDGIYPTVEREPGESVFLALVYAVTGPDRPTAVFLIQHILFLAAAMFFFGQLQRTVGSRAAGVGFLLLATSGSVLHASFTLVRESLALSLLLLLGGLYVRDGEGRSAAAPIVIGVLASALILTYYPFVFFVVLLALLWLIDRRGILRLGIVAACVILTVGGWIFRNISQGFGPVVIGQERTNVLWYVRGEQAESIRGLEPFRCLWSEYVSRDWTGRAPACSFNALMHGRWPEGFAAAEPSDLKEAGRSGRAKILEHPLAYLWFSAWEVAELHIPYLGGGVSHGFNLSIALSALLLYAGFLVGLTALRDRRLLFLTLLMAYAVAVFALTDATPRYLVPVLFVYCAVAGIGYDRLLQKVRRSPAVPSTVP